MTVRPSCNNSPLALASPPRQLTAESLRTATLFWLLQVWTPSISCCLVKDFKLRASVTGPASNKASKRTAKEVIDILEAISRGGRGCVCRGEIALRYCKAR